MSADIETRRRQFKEKAVLLAQELQAWFEEETAPIDGAPASPPGGAGGSIVGIRPAIDSKRVVDAARVTRAVLDIELPPEIIKRGGYESCEEMIDDLMPKLERVYTGELKVKKRRLAKVAEPA